MINQSKWEPEKTESRHADEVTINHIISLRNRLTEAEKQRDNALNACMFLRKQIDALQKTLDGLKND